MTLIETDDRFRDLTPWDALILSVRLAATRVAQMEERLAVVVRDRGGVLDPDDRTVARLTHESRLERGLLSRTSKMAVDAGIAARVVAQAEHDGKVIVQVLGRVLDDLNLGQVERVRVHGLVHRELLAIAAGEVSLPDDDLPMQTTHLRYQDDQGD